MLYLGFKKGTQIAAPKLEDLCKKTESKCVVTIRCQGWRRRGNCLHRSSRDFLDKLARPRWGSFRAAAEALALRVQVPIIVIYSFEY